MKQTFDKSERLCSKKIIDRLFEKGSTEVKTFYLFPFKVFYIVESSPTDFTASQVLFSVSKRNFKRAVARNLLRRRCREAYRKNKYLLSPSSTQILPMYMAFVLIAKEEVSYAQIEKSMQKILKQIATNI